MSAAGGSGLSMRLLVFRGSGGGGANRCCTRGGHSCCGDRHDVADYLNARGWKTDQFTMAELFAEYGQTLVGSADETADFGSFTYVTATRD